MLLMKVRLFISLLVFLSSFSSFAGGVEIGNGKNKETYFYIGGYNSKDEILNIADSILIQIRNKTHPRILEIHQLTGCPLERIEFSALEIQKYYPPIESGFGQKKYQGLFYLKLIQCQTRPFHESAGTRLDFKIF